MRRAIVALARWLAVILHRMRDDGADFRWSNSATAAGALIRTGRSLSPVAQQFLDLLASGTLRLPS